MDGSGGNSNRSTGGLAGFFGGSGAGMSYSNADLAGVPLTGMSPLSPYLNVDPRYLIQDTDEFILPTGANKTRGRFELAFFTIGGCCITGAAFGAVNGLRLGLKETRKMSWSKPRNVQILNMVTRQGALWANTLGSLALLYSAFGVVIEKTRGAEDDINTVAAGTMTGMLYKCTAQTFHIYIEELTGTTKESPIFFRYVKTVSFPVGFLILASLHQILKERKSKLLSFLKSSSVPPFSSINVLAVNILLTLGYFISESYQDFSAGGLRGVARGGLTGLTLTTLYALYNNWEHMKGSMTQQSL